jgi:hypothetical protein
MLPGFYFAERGVDPWWTVGLDGQSYRKTQGRWMLEALSAEAQRGAQPPYSSKSIAQSPPVPAA